MTIQELKAELRDEIKHARDCCPTAHAHGIGYTSVKTVTLEALLEHVEGLENALKGLIPSYRDPEKKCWCLWSADPCRTGHTAACIRAQAALAEQGEKV